MFCHLLSLSALVATILIPATAHTWIEEYQVIGPNGSFIGDRGFSRGYIGREDPDFDGSFNSLNLVPPSDAVMPDGTVRLRINSTDNVCRNSQQTSNYTNPAYPMLKVAPGDYVAMKYLENGHVTLPWNQPGKPPHGGTVYVFGTSQPIEQEMLANVMKWTDNGKGGDGRGRLLATQNFDDSRCHQINDCYHSVERQGAYPNTIPGQPGTVSELWCETDVKMPEDLQSGKYTTYWVWQWPTLACETCPFPEGMDQWYTTCADHEIIAPGADDFVKLEDAPATNTLPGEDFTTMAVSTYKERTALTTYPVTLQNWANFNASATSTTDAKVAAFATSCAQVAATAVVSTGLPPLCPNGKWATGTLAAFFSSKGAESARAASAAWIKAKATLAAGSSAPAPSSTATSNAGASPSSTLTSVKSVITTYYLTTTVTGSPSQSPGGGRPDHHLHQGPPNRASQGGDGFPTVTTEGPNAQTGQTVGASDLEPGHGLSTVAAARMKYVRTTALAAQNTRADSAAAGRKHAREFGV